MAAKEKDKKQRSKKKGVQRGQLPLKRSINLATAEDKHLNWRLVIPAFLLIIVAAVLFGKFGVSDQFARVNQAELEVAGLREQLNQGYAEIAALEGIGDDYAHYTFSGMTNEELNRADRAAVLLLMERIVLPRVPVDTWVLSGNVLTLNVSGRTLQEINTVSQRLLEERIVDYCTVTTASYEGLDKREAQEDVESETVNANLVIYLRGAS